MYYCIFSIGHKDIIMLFKLSDSVLEQNSAAYMFFLL